MGIKLTKEIVNNRLAASEIGAEMIGEYLGSHVKTLFRFNCGHEIGAKPAMVLRGVGCNECRKRTNEDINLELSDRGIVMIGEYKNIHASVKFRFPCGHENISSPNNILRGSGCIKCLRQSKIRSRVEIDNELMIRDIRLIGQYLGIMTKTEFQCLNNHKWITTPNSVLNEKTGCPECAEYGGYKSHLPGWVYIIKFANFIKYGITNNPDRRVADHKRTSGDFEIILLKKYEDGTVPLLMEKSIKNTHGGKFVTKETMSNGWTETLPLSSLTSVLSQLQ